MSSLAYIGRVQDVRVALGEFRFAQVQPIIESDEQHTTWIGPVNKSRNKFPRRGMIHWPRTPAWADAGILCEFEVEPVPDPDTPLRPDRLQVLNVRAISEVIDLRSWLDRSTLRSSVTSSGFSIEPKPLGNSVLLWTEETRLVGPFRIELNSETEEWRVTSPHASQMEVFQISPAELVRVESAGPRLFLPPSRFLTNPIGVENWATDAEVARGVLRRLRKINRPVAEALQVVDRVFLHYLEEIRKSSLGQRDTVIERMRGERLENLRNLVERDVRLLGEVVDVLMESERIRAALDKRIEESFLEARAANEKRIAEASADARETLEYLTKEVSSKEAELLEVSDSLHGKEVELSRRVEGFENAVRSRLREIASNPADAFAELAILRSVFGGGPISSALRTTMPLSIEAGLESRSASVLEDPAAIRAALGGQAIATGTNPITLLTLHASFLAGAIPIVTGERAFSVLAEYSKVVAGGRILWLPVGPTVVEPQDILGHFEPSLGRIVSHPAGLLDVFVRASTSDDLFVVALDGFNRASVDSYLTPLLATIRQVDQDEFSRRSIALANRNVLASDDPYYGFERISWPGNVLLALIPSVGKMALSAENLPWQDCTLISLGNGNPCATDIRSETSKLSEISLGSWQVLKNESLAAVENSIVETLNDLAVASEFDVKNTSTAVRAFQVLRANSIPLEDALHQVIAINIAPRFAGRSEEFDKALSSLRIPNHAVFSSQVEQAERLIG